MLDDRARKFAEVSAKHFGYDRSMVSGAGAAADWVMLSCNISMLRFVLGLSFSWMR